MTEDVLRKLDEAFALGCTDLEACLYADIGKSALYNYQNDHPEFVERKERLKENPVLLARQSVVKALTKDYEHALKFLERKNKKEFSLRTELTGEDGKPLINIDQATATKYGVTPSAKGDSPGQP